MTDQFACPQCAQPLPFGMLTDTCPHCHIPFGYSSPHRPVRMPVPASPPPPAEDRPSPASWLFRIIRLLMGLTLFVLALLLYAFAGKLHLVSHDRADLFVPGGLALIAATLILSRGRVMTIIATVLGLATFWLLWKIVMMIGAAAYAR